MSEEDYYVMSHDELKVSSDEIKRKLIEYKNVNLIEDSLALARKICELNYVTTSRRHPYQQQQQPLTPSTPPRSSKKTAFNDGEQQYRHHHQHQHDGTMSKTTTQTTLPLPSSSTTPTTTTPSTLVNNRHHPPHPYKVVNSFVINTTSRTTNICENVHNTVNIPFYYNLNNYNNSVVPQRNLIEKYGSWFNRRKRGRTTGRRKLSTVISSNNYNYNNSPVIVNHNSYHPASSNYPIISTSSSSLPPLRPPPPSYLSSITSSSSSVKFVYRNNERTRRSDEEFNRFLPQSQRLLKHLRHVSLRLNPEDPTGLIRKLREANTSKDATVVPSPPIIDLRTPERARVVYDISTPETTPVAPAYSPIVSRPSSSHKLPNGNEVVKFIPKTLNFDNVAGASKYEVGKTPVLGPIDYRKSGYFNDSRQPPTQLLELIKPVIENDSQANKASPAHLMKPVKKFSEKMRAEASVVQRISELQKEGMLYERRLPRVHEPSRIKAHWDYLLEEMHWLAADFAQERKWKRLAARKCARMIEKHFSDKQIALKKAQKEEADRVQKIASFIAKEVRNFWSNVQKLVEYKEQSKIEELKKKALDQHLSFIVDQTEKFSNMLAISLNPADESASVLEESEKKDPNKHNEEESGVVSDDDYQPTDHDSDDDEETIARADEEFEDIKSEIDMLNEESTRPLDEILAQLQYPTPTKMREFYRSKKRRGSSKNSSSSSSSEESDSEETMLNTSDDDRSTLSGESIDEHDKPTPDGKEDEQTWGLASLLQTFAPEEAHVNHQEELNSVTQMAESFQPTGYTLSSTKVVTDIPVLLKHTLREYQHIGLDWLVTMYEKKLNGILADEMGLGKTIQTIALLAHLACEKGNWGPHLIIVPTSVMLNWEMEFKKWCPGFKVLTYYGSVKERKIKRQGWTKPNTFHVCITSYKLVIQDHQSFRRKRWRYLILDEAQNIKNFKSQRWQLLLNFNTQRRLLLTGTPLQNNLMELWSLMHFLMPNVFQSHREFREWFSNPVTGMVEGNSEYNENIIARLHKVLRPFILRRLKSEVEKQLPQKYEHVVMCRLSKRQRYLYEEFMSRARTRETLASGNLLSVINILMQLRKVCNHPNLFETRPIISPLQTEGIVLNIPSLVWNMLDDVDLKALSYPLLKPDEINFMIGSWLANRIQDLKPPRSYISLIPFVGLEETVINERNSKRNCHYNCRTPAQSPTKKNVYSWKKPLTPHSPRSISKVPVFVMSEIDPRQSYFQDEEFLSAIIAEASQIPSFSPSHLERLKALEKKCANKRKLETISESKVRPSKVSKLSTGQVEVVKTPSGQRQLVLTGSKYTNGLQTSALLEKKQTTVASEPPIHINATPLTYSTSVLGVSLHDNSFDEIGPKDVKEADPALDQVLNNVLKQEKYSGSRKLGQDDSENQRGNSKQFTLEKNPFHKLKLEFEQNAVMTRSRIMGGNSRLNESALKRKLSDESDEYEDSEEEVTTSGFQLSTKKVVETKKQVEHKREFRVEDVFEDMVYRKRKVLRTADPLGGSTWLRINGFNPKDFELNEIENRRLYGRKTVIERLQKLNFSRCVVHPFYGHDTVKACNVFNVSFPRYDRFHPFDLDMYNKRNFEQFGYFNLGFGEIQSYRLTQTSALNWDKNHPTNVWRYTNAFANIVGASIEMVDNMIRFSLPSIIYIPSVATPQIQARIFRPSPSRYQAIQNFQQDCKSLLKNSFDCLHPVVTRMTTQFPDPRLIQYDCGKLQQLDGLLRRLIAGEHRALIFTQMTKMLDVLEAFLNYHGYIYLRLDGSTKIDQRQLLMEKFNTDKKIFCFILSTRSGGIGVNLTGADTVIFYDSDWNPTMDAQAQDRCHRIGQTRDVHIYRLVSERTVEENILLKSNQKRLLGELAIEGGNFTTAYFKKHTIRDLFDIENGNGDKIKNTRVPIQPEPDKTKEEAIDKNKALILESALAAAEDESDVQAARTVRAEAAAELAEFDETIPLDELGEGREYEEPSLIAMEMQLIAAELSSVERYAFRFMEASIQEWSAETYASAEKQLEEQKRQWELEQLKKKEEPEEPVQDPELFEEDEIFTYAAVDSHNKVWIAQDSEGELMPLWEPPTPPQDESDVYIDMCHQLLYDEALIPEHQLPPIYVPPLKKKKLTVLSPKGTPPSPYITLASSPNSVETSPDPKKIPLKIHRREEPIFAPRSLFDRPTPAVAKLRRDYRLQKYNCRPLSTSPISKTLGPGAVTFPVVPPPITKSPPQIPTLSIESPEWMVSEEFALLQGVTNMLELPLNLMVVSLAQTPNWEFLSETVNMNSVIFRSSKHCKARYESVVGPREEGKVTFDTPALMKKKKAKSFIKIGPPSPQRTRPQIKTAQLMAQDNYVKYTDIMKARFEAVKTVSTRKRNIVRPPGIQKQGKQSVIFNMYGINYDSALTSQNIAQTRLERIQLERRKVLAQQEAARAAAQTQIGTITLPAGQTVSVQATGIPQAPNSVVVQTLPQKLTPSQLEMLKQNLVLSAQLRQSQLGNVGNALPVRAVAPRNADPISLQNIKRIQVVPNSLQSSLGNVSFAITSTTSANPYNSQAPVITLNAPIVSQNSAINQAQFSGNIPPGAIYHRNADGVSLHNVKRIQVVPNSIQSNLANVSFAITNPTSTNTSQHSIITLNSPITTQISVVSTQSPLISTTAPLTTPIYQRSNDGVSLQNVKRIQVVSNSLQSSLGGVSFAVTAPMPSSTSQPSVIPLIAPITPQSSANTHQVTFVQQTPVMTTSQVPTTPPISSQMPSTSTFQARFPTVSMPSGPPTSLAAFVKAQTSKQMPTQAYISSPLQFAPMKPLIVRPRTYSPQQQVHVQQLTPQQQGQLLAASTGQHSVITLNTAPAISQNTSSGHRVTFVHQPPIVTTTQSQTTSAGLPAGTSQMPPTSSFQARFQQMQGNSGVPVTAFVKAPVAPKQLPTQTYISSPIQFTNVKPGVTSQAQIPAQLIVQTTPKQLQNSLQQFHHVFKQVIFRQPVQMMSGVSGQTVAVSLGGTLARPVLTQAAPVRTTVPISAIAQISTGQPQPAQLSSVPKRIQIGVSNANISISQPESAINTAPRIFQTHPQIRFATSLNTETPKTTPILLQPPIQIDSTTYDSTNPKSGPDDPSPGGSSHG